MKPTRIEKIETILWQRWLIVRVHCEDGTVGVGEGGVHGWQRPTETMVKTFAPYLVGQDPSRIEHHYQYLYRSSHFMGSVVQGRPFGHRHRPVGHQGQAARRADLRVDGRSYP